MDYNSRILLTPTQYQQEVKTRKLAWYLRNHPYQAAVLYSLTLPVFGAWKVGHSGALSICHYLAGKNDLRAVMRPQRLSDRHVTHLHRPEESRQSTLTDRFSRLTGLVMVGSLLAGCYNFPTVALLYFSTFTALQSLDSFVNGEPTFMFRACRRLFAGANTPAIEFTALEQVSEFIRTSGGDSVTPVNFPENLYPFLSKHEQGTLLQYLSQLVNSDEFICTGGESRQALVSRIDELLTNALTDPLLKEPTLSRMHDSISGCSDHALLTLSELETFSTLYRLEESIVSGGIEEDVLLKIAIQMFFFEQVRKYSIDFHRRQPFPPEGGHIEVENTFHVLLRDSADHPLPTSIQRVGNATKSTMPLVTEEDLEALKAHLTKTFIEQIDAFMEGWSPWQKYQRRQSVTAYDSMATVLMPSGEHPVCNISKEPPEEPVMLNGFIYDYPCLRRWFINEGTDPIRRDRMDWSDVLKVNSPDDVKSSGEAGSDQSIT